MTLQARLCLFLPEGSPSPVLHVDSCAFLRSPTRRCNLLWTDLVLPSVSIGEYGTDAKSKLTIGSKICGEVWALLISSYL